MAFVQCDDRMQIFMQCQDEWVDTDSPVRVIDSFVDSIAIKNIEFNDHGKDVMGRPAYSTSKLLKLYIYGYMCGIKSSRKLARNCKINLEVRWLMQCLEPNFRTIARFRAENAESLARVFDSFLDFCSKLTTSDGKPLMGRGFESIDGTKIRASQAKDTCYTASKTDDRISNDESRIEQYRQFLKEMDETDAGETGKNEPITNSVMKEELEKKLKEYEERKKEHEEIRDRIEAGESQIAMTDTDSKLMKSHYGSYNPSYNVQAAVNSETHMIVGVNTTNQCTDHGLLSGTMEKVHDDNAIREVVADNGYMQSEDIANCLENGIVPNVFPDKVRTESGAKVHKDGYDVEFDYDAKAEITDEMKASTNREDIARCLHAGVIPDCYKDRLEHTGNDGNAGVVTIRKFEYEVSDSDFDGMSDDEKRTFAAEHICFIRDIDKGRVYCPYGEILRKKSDKKNDVIRYCNKLACKRCTMKCFRESQTTRWKEIDFAPGARIKACNVVGADKAVKKKISETTVKNHLGKTIKKVVYRFKPDFAKLDKRKCLSEHPFGTMKRNMNGDHFLLRGIKKVDAEIKLTCLGYNITRLVNLIPVTKILNAMAM